MDEDRRQHNVSNKAQPYALEERVAARVRRRGSISQFGLLQD
jgi:hypothetical protein